MSLKQDFSSINVFIKYLHLFTCLDVHQRLLVKVIRLRPDSGIMYDDEQML